MAGPSTFFIYLLSLLTLLSQGALAATTHKALRTPRTLKRSLRARAVDGPRIPVPVASGDAAASVEPTTDLSACPAGSSRAIFEDDFTNLDESKWSLGEYGAEQREKIKQSMTFNNNGMTITLSETLYDVALASTSKWVAPMTMQVTTQSSEAPGAVSCAIMKNQGKTDEIDLELIRNTAQIPIWEKPLPGSQLSQRLRLGTDVTETPGTAYTRSYPYVYTNTAKPPYSSFQTYNLTWAPDYVRWENDGSLLAHFQKNSTNTAGTGLYPREPLQVRIGTWMAEADVDPASRTNWAEGKIDWQKYPNPKQIFKHIRVEGCKVDEPASGSSATAAAPSTPSNTSVTDNGGAGVASQSSAPQLIALDPAGQTDSGAAATGGAGSGTDEQCEAASPAVSTVTSTMRI